MKKLIAQFLCVCLVFTCVALSLPQQADALSYSGSASYRSGRFYAALTNVKLTGDQRRDIVSVAKTQIGYQEGENSSHLSGEVAGGNNYTEYGRWYTSHKGTSYNHISSQWCAMFVSWCAYNAGVSTSIITCEQYTETQVKLFKNQGRAHRWSTVQSGAYTPKSGDIVYFLSSSGAASGRTVNHVGIVTGWDGSTLYTIEGNTSSAYFSTDGGCCSDKTYSISSTYVAYICDPAYEDNSEVLSDEVRSSVFDANYYAEKHADLKNAFGTDEELLYNHFKDNGMKEGRQASAIFDVQYYVQKNSDLTSIFGTDYVAALEHFVEYGYKEPRYTAKSVDVGTDFFATINYKSAGLAIGVSGTNVVTATPDSSDSQLWYFERNSDGSYVISNYASGLALDVENGSYSLSTNVQIIEKDGTNAQSWFIFENLNGTYSLRPKCAPACVLDIHAASTAAGANVQIYTYNSTPAQQFTITKDTSIVFEKEFDCKSAECETATSEGNVVMTGFTAGTDISQAVDMFNDTCKIFDENGSLVSDGRLCTGYTIKKYIGGIEANSAIVIVTGDITGDGAVTAKDVIRAKKKMLNSQTKGYLAAIDVDGSQTVTDSDITVISGLIK